MVDMRDLLFDPNPLRTRLNPGVVRSILLPTLLAMSLGSSATSPQRGEPADLVAPGQSVPQLLQLGWEISPAITVEEAASRDGLADSVDWQRFKSRMRPGDALRPVSHNAGMGYALFRGGELADMFLVIVF